ncbi:uncharacterized protein [Dysidea avara]|uniref:uncharacterized protein n=1 Tax=Dysidea avara TaxID=196820 RepID=UPI0033266209
MPHSPDASQNNSYDFASGSGGLLERSKVKVPCCISGNCAFPSITDSLNNMSSNNTIVNIRTDVELSSDVTLETFENIMIIGHRNPVVKCYDVGAIKFISCKNVTIEGIQWEGCGSNDYPGIEFYNSSNVFFQRCSFHNSKGRSVLLSKVTGKVYVKYCNFTHKNEYRGHGAAIHYLPNTNSSTENRLEVQNCKFISNRANQSVIYFNGSGSSIPGHVYLQDSVFVNNTGVPIYISYSYLHFKGIVLFKGNTAKSGGGIYSSNSTITFYDKSDVKFINNSATNDEAFFVSLTVISVGLIDDYHDYSEWSGGAIYSDNSNITFSGNSSVTFNDNKASFKGGVICCKYSSRITFDANSNVKFISNKVTDYGGAVFCEHATHITFDSNSSVTFNNNKARNGGAINCETSSHITFDGNSSVTFNNNEASDKGGAVYGAFSSHITFDGNSSVTFNNNEASFDGGAVYCYGSSHITFDGNSSVTFYNNNASDDGGAVYCGSSSNITFDGNSSVAINNNTASFGGAVYCQDSITFDGNSSITFSDNEASDHGGAVHCEEFYLPTCTITFEGNTIVSFNDNAARDGGAVYCESSFRITFDSNASVTFDKNEAIGDGGAIYGDKQCDIIFHKSTLVTFNSNKASNNGGAVCTKSHIIFEENSTINLNNNIAGQGGGAIVSSNVTFMGSSSTTFHNNLARRDGAAIYCNNSIISFVNNCYVVFHNNTAIHNGGAIYLFNNAVITFNEYSDVIFINNKAMHHGGAIHSENQVIFLLEGHSSIAFKNNTASQSGGALYITDYSTAMFTEHSEVTYSNNEATQYGGAVYCVDNSNITLTGNVLIEFTNNTSENGGALSVLQSFILLKGDISVIFISNKAENGGAISVAMSSVIFSNNSQAMFLSNSAAESGGVMHLSNRFKVNFCNNSNITFYHNNANHHGGAIYCDLTKSIENRITFSTTNVVFEYNTDFIDSDIYIDVTTSCNETCFNKNIINSHYDQFGGIIKTSPRKLEFKDTAICIDSNDNNDTICETYLISNIMLGQEIIINACVLDYYNESAESTLFVLSRDNQDYNITGSNNMLISCTVFEGVSLSGKRVSEATNYSMNITSYEGSVSDVKKISIELITELSPCHPGFHYDNTTQTCVCYSDSNFVSCSGNTSSIKRGYWFGEVNDKATVTVCPNNYCNFTCCKATNEFFKLSPVRANQCNLQRSGTACGSCKEGYTLSFDSVQCVNVDTCTTGQTVLVVTLSILYWVVIVVLVFIVTYYHIGIGYLYAITYYYSMVDILLSEHLYSSQGLFTFVSIMSSIAKVAPQFLGQLCLVSDMSGIDQQFIHYVHPLAVAIIVAVICVSARVSYKFSSFVSRGIIHVVCFLLLLSYTSVATTSLLLLRSLSFDNVDKVYTYLSPDIEYLHGRHLPYFILALLCTLIITIGLPFLLIIEPFVNHKINFIRIKPLLDQFQGCYKDKYRSFAAYHMICRLVIILIIIANPSNNDTSHHLLIISNSLLAFVHLTLRPCRSNILNLFDGFVLYIMILVSLMSLIDSYDPDLLLSFMFALVILPLIPFLIMEIYLYKNTIKKITEYCVPPKPDTTNDNNNVPMRHLDSIDSKIDDSRRVEVTLCKTKESEMDDATHFRESFMEVIDDIDD